MHIFVTYLDFMLAICINAVIFLNIIDSEKSFILFYRKKGKKPATQNSAPDKNTCFAVECEKKFTPNKLTTM